MSWLGATLDALMWQVYTDVVAIVLLFGFAALVATIVVSRRLDSR